MLLRGKYMTVFRALVAGVGVLLLIASGKAIAAEQKSAVSFTKDVLPILMGNCNGCHSPEKKKGGLDMTSYGALMNGGKEGKEIVAGEPAKSVLITQVSGKEPAMPAKGEPLTEKQIALLAKWIEEGAKDDSPVIVKTDAKAGMPGPSPIEKPPLYAAAPVITSLAYSPDGKILAVSGYSEIVLHKADGSGVVGRLLSGTPRIEAIVYSKDGKLLAACGGRPAMLGHVQIWEVASGKQVGNYQVGRDSVFGISFSPDGEKVAVGCVDKSARVLKVANGEEVLRLDQHADWCLATTFTTDGKRLLTGGRDKGMKLTDLERGQFIDDINNPLEGVLCMAKHPTEDVVLYGGDLGTARIYKISDNQKRTAARNDTNLMRTFERQPGPCHSVAWNGDGSQVAIGSVGEVRIYDVKTGNKVITCSGIGGGVFAVKFHPSEKQIVCGGYDGKVRIYSSEDGKLVKEFIPVSVGQSVAGK
jgi:mono/diheme cytochrome c family protein